MKTVVLVLLVALSQEAPLDELRWLAGCWEQRRGERLTLEMWMPPAGGLMLGASRTTVGGTLRETETLRLEMREGRLVYTASPSRQATTAFTGAPPTGAGFTVENLAHDFPQRISYRRAGADSLVARIEGPDGSGGTRGIDFPMARRSCTAG